MEAAERLAFYSLAANLVTYLISSMHQSLPSAVTTVSNWIGAAYILGIPGGFLADSYLGRFHSIVLHSLLYIAVKTLLTLIKP
jgi:peptide/histidine transporter 3/4